MLLAVGHFGPSRCRHSVWRDILLFSWDQKDLWWRNNYNTQLMWLLTKYTNRAHDYVKKTRAIQFESNQITMQQYKNNEFDNHWRVRWKTQRNSFSPDNRFERQLPKSNLTYYIIYLTNYNAVKNSWQTKASNVANELKYAETLTVILRGMPAWS